jgi:hypothetical protein
MNTIEFEQLRFPIGQFINPDSYNPQLVEDCKRSISDFPAAIEKLTANLSREELDWNYRPDGWNIRQLVHHCADSHMNAFIRFKLALTEDTPRIRPYHEKSWALTADVTKSMINNSLLILEGLHQRWIDLLDDIGQSEFELSYLHPEFKRQYSLYEALVNYDWHCRHHLEHIRLCLKSKGAYL